MPEVTTWDFRKVSLIIDGVYITGFMDGSPISAEPNEDSKIPHIGAAGDVTFAESNDETGTITVTLKQNSTSNRHLNDLSKQRGRTFPIQVIDSNGNVKCGGTQAVVLTKPSAEWGNEVAGMEWSFYVADFSYDIA